MICENCKEETGIGASHAYNRKTGEWLCPSLPLEERQPWVAVRVLQAEVSRLNLQNQELQKKLGGLELGSRLLNTAIDKSNEALKEAVKTKEERDNLLRLNGELRDYIEDIGGEVPERLKAAFIEKPVGECQHEWTYGTGQEVCLKCPATRPYAEKRNDEMQAAADPRKGCRDFAHLGQSESAPDEKGEWTLTRCLNCGQVI